MAVRNLDAMAAKCRRQLSRARRRYAPLQSEVLDRNPGAGDLIREPAFTLSGDEEHALPAQRLDVFRQLGDDAPGASGAVRLDQISNPQSCEWTLGINESRH